MQNFGWFRYKTNKRFVLLTKIKITKLRNSVKSQTQNQGKSISYIMLKKTLKIRMKT